MEANTLFGRPWRTTSRFDTFEAADMERKKLSLDKNLQVKVKKQLKGFVVKVRLNLEEQPKRLSGKKQRKERKNDR
tara:strand:- start:733 stop:960 length:228 start_codon:yes stop_codon:yes gene_type:complete